MKHNSLRKETITEPRFAILKFNHWPYHMFCSHCIEITLLPSNSSPPPQTWNFYKQTDMNHFLKRQVFCICLKMFFYKYVLYYSPLCPFFVCSLTFYFLSHAYLSFQPFSQNGEPFINREAECRSYNYWNEIFICDTRVQRKKSNKPSSTKKSQNHAKILKKINSYSNDLCIWCFIM